MNPVIIALLLQGAPAVMQGMRQVENAGKKMGASLEKSSERGAKGLDSVSKSGRSVNSTLRSIDKTTAKSAAAAAKAWSPYLQILKQIEAAEKRLGKPQSGRPPASPSSPTSPSPRTPKAPSNPNNPFADNQRPVNKGAASAWNPYISAVKQLAQEERVAREEAKRLDAESRKLPVAFNNVKTTATTMWSSFRAGAKASQSDIDDLTGKLKKLDSAVTSVEFNGLQEKAAAARNVGLGVMASGVAVGAVGVKTAMNADEMNMTRKGLSFSLGGDDKADAAIERLQGIDRESSFDFRETTQLFKQMLGKGFTEAEAFKRLTSTGDMVARTGGNTDNLSAVLRQMGQGKAKGKFEKQDLDVMAEAGGLPIYQLLKDNLDPARFQEMMSGKKVLTADEFFSVMDKVAPQFAGGMKEGNDSLAGDMSNFNSAMFQLGAILGQYVLPPLRATVRFGTGVADFFRSLPAPFQAVIAYGGGLFAIIAILGGGLLALMGSVAGAVLNTWALIVAVGAETTAKNLATGATSRLAIANLMSSKVVFGKTIPAMGALGIALVAIAVIIWGFSKAVEGYAATTTKSAAEVKEAHGIMGELWISLGDWLTAFMNHKFWGWIGKSIDPGNLLGLRDDAKQKADSDEEKAIALTNKGLAKRGKPLVQSQNGRENVDEYIPLTEEEKQKRESEKLGLSGSGSGLSPDIQAMLKGSGTKGGVGTLSPDMAATLSAIPTTTAAMPMPAMPTTGASNNIEALEDAAAANNKNYDPNSPEEQLRRARRARKHENEAKRDAKAAESAQNKAQRDKMKRAREAVYLGAELRADGSVDFQDIGEMVDTTGIETETAYLLRRKAIHGAPQEKAKREREAKKEANLQRRQQLAMNQLQYDEILDDPNSTKAQREEARRMKRQLSRQARFQSIGLNAPPVTARSGGNSMLSRLMGGASLFDLAGNGGRSGDMGGADSTEAGGAIGYGKIVRQSPGSSPSKIKLYIEGEVETTSQLSKQLSGVVGGFG